MTISAVVSAYCHASTVVPVQVFVFSDHLATINTVAT